MKEHSYPQQSSKSANWNHQDLLCKKLLLIVKLWFWRHLNWIYLHWRMFCTLCACTPWSDAQSEFCERKGKGSINWKKQKWKQAKRKGCINWHKKMEQNKESWALRQKKVVRLSEHGIQNQTNDQFFIWGYEEKYGKKANALSELKAKREEKERKEKLREERERKKEKKKLSESESGSDYEKLGRGGLSYTVAVFFKRFSHCLGSGRFKTGSGSYPMKKNGLRSWILYLNN